MHLTFHLTSISYKRNVSPLFIVVFFDFSFAIKISNWLLLFQDQKQTNKSNGHNHSHSSTHMNMRGAFLHVLSDALGSIIVVISALVVWLTDWKYRYYMDPALSILLVILILNSVWPLLRESALILLQTVPTHIQVIVIATYRFESCQHGQNNVPLKIILK